MESCNDGECWYVSKLTLHHLTQPPTRCVSLRLIRLPGTYLIVFVTAWANLSPNSLPEEPGPEFGYFANAAYLGPATGGVINFILLTLLIFAFGTVSGAHFNPVSHRPCHHSYLTKLGFSSSPWGRSSDDFAACLEQSST